jgi:hypothetical protein
MNAVEWRQRDLEIVVAPFLGEQSTCTVVDCEHRLIGKQLRRRAPRGVAVVLPFGEVVRE